MGGSQFLRKPLRNGGPIMEYTRMSLSVDSHVSYHYTKLLRDLFKHVVVPPQAPEEKDFGDVDMLVYGPKARLQELLAQARAEELYSPCKARRLPLKVLQGEIVEQLNADVHFYRDHNDVLSLHVEIPCYVETQHKIAEYSFTAQPMIGKARLVVKLSQLQNNYTIVA